MDFLRLVPFRLLLWYENRILDNYPRCLDFVTGRNEEKLKVISERKLEHAFRRALTAPAYREFLKKHHLPARPLAASEIASLVPVVDKKSYIKKYSQEQRCAYGRLPVSGNIDESAGSSGRPTDWVRSYAEENLLLKSAYFEYMYAFKKKKQAVVLSAWSTGPWATGVKFCELVEHFALVKNTDTNPEDIKSTLLEFGDRYHYIIAGYPLFLQSLFESRFPWKRYDIDILTGGDGYSSIWPKRIKKRLKKGAKVISSYGCSDIDIGIGFETVLAQEIREEAAANKKLAREIFGGLEVTPMLFQYNPSLHYIHNLPGGEFAITHLDPAVASPKIKYNIHDLGRSLPFFEMMRALEKHAPHLLRKARKKNVLHLPFLYIAGRSDGTLSFDGANVFPENIDLILARKMLKFVENFKMVKKEKQAFPFHVLVELRRGTAPSAKLAEEIRSLLSRELPLLNRDFAESLENNPQLAPQVDLFAFHQGPFKPKKEIKYSFIQK